MSRYLEMHQVLFKVAYIPHCNPHSPRRWRDLSKADLERKTGAQGVYVAGDPRKF